jgi:hypothetical protein
MLPPFFKEPQVSENPSQPCVTAALVEVRKAYRLLWLYQQSLMDAYAQILRHLDVKFYFGELDPLQRSTTPPETTLHIPAAARDQYLVFEPYWRTEPAEAGRLSGRHPAHRRHRRH